MEKLAARLQLKDFRLIHAIDRSGQLALAAEQLAITQPAASRMLAILKTNAFGVFDVSAESGFGVFFFLPFHLLQASSARLVAEIRTKTRRW